MATAFTRQLGAESGVQLNPLQDNSELASLWDNSDQCLGTMIRSTRGRVDKPFRVNRGNIYRALGFGENIRVTRLNEAFVHLVEAVNSGTYEAIVQRLVKHDEVKINYIVIRENKNVDSITGDVVSYSYDFSVETNVPDSGFMLAIKHLGCFNDGISVAIHADENKVGGVKKENTVITLRLFDPKDDAMLFEFTGSLINGTLDESGSSYYLPDVISAQTDLVIAETGDVFSIPVNLAAVPSPAYGYHLATGKVLWSKSSVMNYFFEGSTGYDIQDYQTASDKLRYTPLNYGYIASCGSRSIALLSQLAQLAFDTNRQLKFDIAGELPVEAAVSFVEQLNMGASQTAHLIHAYWTPLTSNDPSGVNSKSYFGTSTLNIAFCNLKNARTNARGFSPKNYPVAGREFPIRRTRITQMVDLTDQDLNTLAKAKINPVVYENYTGGGRYVFRDSLTCALTETSMKKLISVSDMSTSIDEAVTRFGKDVTHLPMKVAIKRVSDFLTNLFEGAEASGWLVPAKDPDMLAKAWKFTVAANASRPADRLDINYWLRYDGVARQIFVTQTLVM